MILELATIDIKENSQESFENALAEAKNVIAKTKGFISIEVQKCVEANNRYILLIKWETLENHTVGFRNSELFIQWRALIGPFFESPPLVQHYFAI